jgi:hypothetical protein
LLDDRFDRAAPILRAEKIEVEDRISTLGVKTTPYQVGLKRGRLGAAEEH